VLLEITKLQRKSNNK